MAEDEKEVISAFRHNGKVYREMEQNCSKQNHLKFCYKDIAMTFEHNARLLTILTKDRSRQEINKEVMQNDFVAQ